MPAELDEVERRMQLEIEREALRRTTRPARSASGAREGARRPARARRRDGVAVGSREGDRAVHPRDPGGAGAAPARRSRPRKRAADYARAALSWKYGKARELKERLALGLQKQLHELKSSGTVLLILQAGGTLTDDGSAAAAEGGKKPYGLYVHGRYDTTGAVRSVQSIVGALPWRQAAPVLEVLGDVGEAEREAAYELGGTLAALVMG